MARRLSLRSYHRPMTASPIGNEISDRNHHGVAKSSGDDNVSTSSKTPRNLISILIATTLLCQRKQSA